MNKRLGRWGDAKRIHRRYQEKASEAQSIASTFRKFVPKQFLKHLGDDVGKLRLGHADEDHIAVLFCDIINFTELSERLTPQETLNFLNAYFMRMNAPIHEHHGFIDKFIGDGIFAIFDRPDGTFADRAEDAIQAGLDLLAALAIYNSHRANCGYEPIEIAIGVHFGPVIIGTVGSDDRMDTTVLGDTVNVASHLETLCRKYQTPMLVSAETIALLDDQHHFKVHSLGQVQVKARKQSVEIYQIMPD